MTNVIHFPRERIDHAADAAISDPGHRHPASHHHDNVEPWNSSDRGAVSNSGEPTTATTDAAVPAFVRAMADRFREPGLPDPAMVVACALRWTTRRGRKLSSLPKLIRAQLGMLCDASDPTAMLVRDWIEGRGPIDLAVDTRADVEQLATVEAQESGRV